MRVQIAVAIIQDAQGRVLAGQRKNAPNDSCAGLWEFPGGKVEAGESQEQCLVRECLEEVGVTVRVGRLYETVEHTYPERTVAVNFWLAQVEKGTVHACVHDALQWVKPQALEAYDWCPANASVIKRLTAEWTEEPLG